MTRIRTLLEPDCEKCERRCFERLLTGNEQISSRSLLLERRRVSVNWQVLGCLNWTALIDWLSNNIDDSSEALLTDWHLNWGASIGDGLASDETLSGVQSDGSHVVSSKMLGDLEHESVLSSLNFESVENWWEFTGELHVHDGTNNLRNLSTGGKGSCKTRQVIM